MAAGRLQVVDGFQEDRAPNPGQPTGLQEAGRRQESEYLASALVEARHQLGSRGNGLRWVKLSL